MRDHLTFHPLLPMRTCAASATGLTSVTSVNGTKRNVSEHIKTHEDGRPQHRVVKLTSLPNVTKCYKMQHIKTHDLSYRLLRCRHAQMRQNETF